MSEDETNIPAEFLARLDAARAEVSAARRSGDRLRLADSLKELGNIERRPPQLRDDADVTFAEGASIYDELGMPLEAAWAIRHIGIDHEYAERLEDAEACYDRSLEIFRRHASDDSLNYANTVRYPAVIKDRLGKREESRTLWEEALARYERLDLPVAVAEAASWLTTFAIERGDIDSARAYFHKAEAARAAANDRDTDIFVDEVRAKLTSPMT